MSLLASESEPTLIRIFAIYIFYFYINWGEPERAPPSRLNACAVYIIIYIFGASLCVSHLVDSTLALFIYI